MSTSGVRGVQPAVWNNVARDARRTPLANIVLHLAPTTRSVSIRTDDERIADYARVAYRRLLIGEARSNAVSDHAELLTAQSPAALCFNDLPLRPDGRLEPAPHAGWSSGAYLVDQCVWRSLAADPDWFAVYGLAFAWRGRAALVVGESGIGKTTLALALSARGAQLYGDEMILVHRKRHDVIGLARMLTIRPGSVEYSGNDRARRAFRTHAERLAADGETFALDAELLGPFPEAQRLALLAIAARDDREPALTPMSALRAALRLAAFVSPRPVHAGELTALADLLAGIESSALTLGEPRATAARLMLALDACS